MKNTFHCSVCDLDKVHEDEISTGYGTDNTGAKVCFECCGKQDKEKLLTLKTREKIVLYWANDRVTNWPGTLNIKPSRIYKSKTNWNLNRTDFWFNLEGKSFHGYHIGHNSQIAHIYKTKQ